MKLDDIGKEEFEQMFYSDIFMMLAVFASIEEVEE